MLFAEWKEPEKLEDYRSRYSQLPDNVPAHAVEYIIPNEDLEKIADEIPDDNFYAEGASVCFDYHPEGTLWYKDVQINFILWIW